jgi:hypothetical protein
MHNNNSKTNLPEELESTPSRTRTRSKKKTVSPPAVTHVNGILPITVTTTRQVLINLVGALAASQGYALATHGDPAGATCVHEAMRFDLVPLNAESCGDMHGAWFWNVTLEDVLTITGHMDRDKPELPANESDKVALDA